MKKKKNNRLCVSNIFSPNFNLPDGTLYENVRLKLLGIEEIYDEIERIRKEFNIPKRGFTFTNDIFTFLDRLKRKGDNIIDTEKIEAEFSKIKSKESRRKIEQAWINKLPTCRFEQRIDDIRRQAKINTNLSDYVKFLVLSEKIEWNNYFPQLSSVCAPFNFCQSNYKISYDGIAGVKDGILNVKIFAPLRKAEWFSLKQNVDKIFESDFPELKPRPYPQKDIEKNLKIMKGKTVHDSYDSIFGEKEIGEDRGEMINLKKQRQRLKKRIGT